MVIRKFLSVIFLSVSALISSISIAETNSASPTVIAKYTGTVTSFNEVQGFGFIKEDKTGKEYFVYVSGLIDQVFPKTRVEFDLENDKKKGLQAVNVRVIPQ